MKNLRVAICHQTVTVGDASSNDVFGMYDVCARIGLNPLIVCEYAHPDVQGKKITTDFNARDIKDYFLIIYHHSIYWEKGNSLVEEARGNLLFKFHNITPPEFFSPYSAQYAEICANGYRQTEKFAKLEKSHYWLADSIYNKDTLIALGGIADRIIVVPPFTQVDQLLTCRNTALYSTPGPYYALFVGRFVPNKGHLDLLRVVDAYKRRFGGGVKLRIVGAWNHELARYRAEVEEVIRSLDLHGDVEIFPHVPQEKMIELFQTSHVYLCFSRHEGFCVPLIEAQAVGLPVIATDSGAKRETAGEGQLVNTAPASELDYVFYARLIDEVCKNSHVRETVQKNGYKNVMQRFSREKIENAFVQAIAPFLLKGV